MQLCREQAATEPENREFAVPLQLRMLLLALRGGALLAGGRDLPKAPGSSRWPQLCGGSGEPQRRQGGKAAKRVQGWLCCLCLAAFVTTRRYVAGQEGGAAPVGMERCLSSAGRVGWPGRAGCTSVRTAQAAGTARAAPRHSCWWAREGRKGNHPS